MQSAYQPYLREMVNQSAAFRRGKCKVRIRIRAYLLWEADGRAHGRDEHYWREAIVQLQAERIQPSPSPSTEPDTVVVEKAQRASTTGKDVANKATKQIAEADDSARADAGKKASRKGATKATTKAADKAPQAAVEPKPAAKKSKTAKRVSEDREVAATALPPARLKKPRKSASVESKISAQ